MAKAGRPRIHKISVRDKKSIEQSLIRRQGEFKEFNELIVSKRRYTSILEFKRAVESYFEKCDAEAEQVKKEGGKEKVRKYTMSGLALHLGFKSRNALFHYKKDNMFIDAVSNAVLRIEQHLEVELFMEVTQQVLFLHSRIWVGLTIQRIMLMLLYIHF
jgi:hypothetical protein